MELDMYGDPKKKCCVCEKLADLKEGSKHYCCDHYAIYILGFVLEQKEKELEKEYEIF
nr:hypothetical protein [uncultured Mediterranean phage uvMED]|tara:strand:+ start:399 stop:572 length:174 start_codon:yes stop_codon:yes gene_type:complete